MKLNKNSKNRYYVHKKRVENSHKIVNKLNKLAFKWFQTGVEKCCATLRSKSNYVRDAIKF